jgi:DNA-binding CsgD family transcriptional regulator
MSSSPSSSSDNGSGVNANGSARVGDLAAMARILVKLRPTDDAVARKRKLVAQFCRLVGQQVGCAAPAAARRPASGDRLPPRPRETLRRLLAGDSEKQIARRMGVSPHTVHVYVKHIYRHYRVSSRGELLARFVVAPAL